MGLVDGWWILCVIVVVQCGGFCQSIGLASGHFATSPRVGRQSVDQSGNERLVGIRRWVYCSVYYGSLVGRSIVSRIFITGLDVADEIQMGHLVEWHYLCGTSSLSDSLYSTDDFGMDMEYLVCQEWQSTDDHLGACHVEFSHLSGKLAGTIDYTYGNMTLDQIAIVPYSLLQSVLHKLSRASRDYFTEHHPTTIILHENNREDIRQPQSSCMGHAATQAVQK